MSGRPRGPGRPAIASTPADDPEDAYRLLVIEPTSAPDGGSGKDWFTYRITQGVNSIRGYKRGSREAVTAEVQQIVISLNERRGVRRGRVDLTTTPKAAARAGAPPTDASS